MEQLRLLQSCLAAINESETKSFQKPFPMPSIPEENDGLPSSSSGGRPDSNLVQELMRKLDIAETGVRNHEIRAKESEEALFKLRHRLAEVTHLHSETLVQLRHCNAAQTELRAQVHEAASRAQTAQTLINSWVQESSDVSVRMNTFSDRFKHLEDLALRHQHTADRAIEMAQKFKTTLETIQRRNNELQARICDLEEQNIRLQSRDTILSTHVAGLEATVAAMKQSLETLEARRTQWNKGMEATQQSLNDFFLQLDSKLGTLESQFPLLQATPVAMASAIQGQKQPSQPALITDPTVTGVTQLSFNSSRFWEALANQEPQFTFSEGEVQSMWNLFEVPFSSPTSIGNQSETSAQSLSRASPFTADPSGDYRQFSPDSWLAKLIQILSPATNIDGGGSRKSHPEMKEKPKQGTTSPAEVLQPSVAETISDCREIHQLLEDHHKREVYISLLELQLSRLLHRLTSHPQNDQGPLANPSHAVAVGGSRLGTSAPPAPKGSTRQRRIVRVSDDDGLLP